MRYVAKTQIHCDLLPHKDCCILEGPHRTGDLGLISLNKDKDFRVSQVVSD